MYGLKYDPPSCSIELADPGVVVEALGVSKQQGSEESAFSNQLCPSKALHLSKRSDRREGTFCNETKTSNFGTVVLSGTEQYFLFRVYHIE